MHRYNLWGIYPKALNFPVTYLSPCGRRSAVAERGQGEGLLRLENPFLLGILSFFLCALCSCVSPPTTQPDRPIQPAPGQNPSTAQGQGSDLSKAKHQPQETSPALKSPLPARGGPPASTPETQDVPTLIRQLGDPNYFTREKAQQTLIQMGDKALPSIQRAEKHYTSYEVVNRSHFIEMSILIGRAALKKFPRDQSRNLIITLYYAPFLEMFQLVRSLLQGGVLDPDHVEGILKLLQKKSTGEKDKNYAQHQILDLIKSLDRLSYAPLARIYLDSPTVDIQVAAIQTLEALHDTSIFPRLLSLLQSPEADRQKAAFIGIPKGGIILQSPEVALQKAATEAFISLARPENLPQLKTLLTHPSADVRSAALYALGRLHATSLTPAVAQALQDPSQDVQKAALKTLGEWEAKEYYSSIVPFLDKPDEGLKIAAVEALARFHHLKDSLDKLLSFLTPSSQVSPPSDLQKTVIRQLGQFKQLLQPPERCQVLVRFLENSSNFSLIQDVAATLAKIQAKACLPSLLHLLDILHQQYDEKPKKFTKEWSMILSTAQWKLPNLLELLGFYPLSLQDRKRLLSFLDVSQYQPFHSMAASALTHLQATESASSFQSLLKQLTNGLGGDFTEINQLLDGLAFLTSSPQQVLSYLKEFDQGVFASSGPYKDFIRQHVLMERIFLKDSGAIQNVQDFLKGETASIPTPDLKSLLNRLNSLRTPKLFQTLQKRYVFLDDFRPNMTITSLPPFEHDTLPLVKKETGISVTLSPSLVLESQRSLIAILGDNQGRFSLPLYDFLGRWFAFILEKPGTVRLVTLDEARFFWKSWLEKHYPSRAIPLSSSPKYTQQK